MLAVVFVGSSKRLPNKHFMEVKPGLRLIELLLNSLKGAGLEILVFSKIDFNYPAPFLKDPTEWIIPAFLYLSEELHKRKVKEFIAVAGDMPLISSRSVKLLVENLSRDSLALIPRWENGWLEPLFAIYRLPFFKSLELAFKGGARSLQSAIRDCQGVSFIKAELFPSYTFFNVNNLEDLFKLREILDEGANL